MIKSVILWQNGMVMVGDENGQQLGQYQGHVDSVRLKILANAPEDAEFFFGYWRNKKLFKISRDAFSKENFSDAPEVDLDGTIINGHHRINIKKGKVE